MALDSYILHTALHIHRERYTPLSTGEKMKEKADEVKIQNIIDMAISLTAMGRVFEKGSTEKIKRKLNNCIKDFF